MNSVPENLPDDLQLLKQMLAKMQSRVGFLEEENALLRQRLFGRKCEQTADPATPQLALFNVVESIADVADEDREEEVVAPALRRGKRKPLLNAFEAGPWGKQYPRWLLRGVELGIG